MANTLNYNLIAEHDEFKQRVRFMLVKIAYEVRAESDTVNYANERKDFADRIIRDPDNHVNKTCLNLIAQQGIYQNMHVVTDETLAQDIIDFDPDPVVGDLVYDGSKIPSANFDGMDQGIEEQIENIYNDLAGIDIPVA